MAKTTTWDAGKILSRNIICLRKRHHLSRRRMAQIMGVGIATLARVESGELPRRMKASALLNLSNYFHFSTDELLHDDLS